MTEAELVLLVAYTLESADRNHDEWLVNFVDDEIKWQSIAAVAVETIRNVYLGEVPWVQQ
jgi:hypothetical protein